MKQVTTSLSVKPPSVRWTRYEAMPTFIRPVLLAALKATKGPLPSPSTYIACGGDSWYAKPVYALGGHSLRVGRSEPRSFLLLASGSSNREQHINSGNILTRMVRYLNLEGLLLQTSSRIRGAFIALPRIRIPLLYLIAFLIASPAYANDIMDSISRDAQKSADDSNRYYEQQRQREQNADIERQMQQQRNEMDQLKRQLDEQRYRP